MRPSNPLRLSLTDCPRIYDRFGRSYLFDIDFWHQTNGQIRKVEKLRTMSSWPEGHEDQANFDKDFEASKKDVERKKTFTIDGFHIGNVGICAFQTVC